MGVTDHYFKHVQITEAVEHEETAPKYWYTRKTALAFLTALFLLVHTLSFLIPPFQSPDEFYHLKRAYLLSTGKVFLDKQKGITGGDIDTGLMQYMDSFSGGNWFFYSPKAIAHPSSEKPSLAQNVYWSDRTTFSEVPYVAAYFPLPYLPQALAFATGRIAGTSINFSYYLARELSLLAALGILCCALFLYPLPPISIALFLVPMTLYQLGSATLDAIAFSITALAGALYMRAAYSKQPFTPGMHVLFALCLFTLATSRTNLFFVTILPLVLYSRRPLRAHLITSVTVLALSLSWLAYVAATVRGTHDNGSELTSQIVVYYLHHLGSFFDVLFATLTNGTIIRFYAEMFVGVFGWSGVYAFDKGILQVWGVFLNPVVYIVFGLLLSSLAVLTFQPVRTYLLSRTNISLTILALLSAFLIFPIFLATWTPHPAQFIFGVQGRYFVSPAILLSFAMFSGPLTSVQRKVCCTLLLVIVLLSSSTMAPTFLGAWWGR